MQPGQTSLWTSLLETTAAIVVIVLLLVGVWIWRKSRTLTLPNSRVFRASRWSRGNRLFPAQVVITPASLTLYHPQWIGKLEESIHMAHISSIKIDTGIMFSDVLVETSGGHNPVVCHGHTKNDAVGMKQLIEKYQSDYYRTEPDKRQAPPPLTPKS